MFVERNHCTVCHAGDLVELYRRPYAQDPVAKFLANYYRLEERCLAGGWEARFAGFDFVLQGCNTCRAVTQRLAPDDDFAVEIYDNWISGDQKHSPEKGRRSNSPERIKEYAHQIQQALILTAFLLRHHKKHYPGHLKILDFGAGWGRFALAMRACGCQVHSFDISAARVEQARRDGLTVTGPDEIPGQEFDFINTEQVFEHLPEPRRTAELLHSGLGPSGVLKISVPYFRWAERGTVEIDWEAGKYGRRTWTAFHPLEHLTYFRRPSLHVMTGALGMTEVRLGRAEQFYYSCEWGGLRSTARNLARMLPRRWFRNYFLFSRN